MTHQRPSARAAALLSTVALSLSWAVPAEGVERWTGPQTLGSFTTPELVDAPAVVFDADGNATAAWQRSGGANDAIEGAARPAAGAFSTLNPPAPSGATNLVLAEGRSGTVFAAWEFTDDQGDQYVQTSVRVRDGGWTAPAVASGAGAGQPAVGVDGGGTGFVAWARLLETFGADLKLIQSRDVRPDGSLGGAQEVARDEVNDLSEPLIDGDDAGAVTVVWSRQGARNTRLEARRRADVTGEYEAAPVLVATVQGRSAADLAVLPQGDAVVSYLAGPDGDEAFAAVRRGLGAFTSDRLSDAEAGAPRVARSAPGALVVWSRSTPEQSLVEVRPWSRSTGFGPTESVASFDGDLAVVAAPSSSTGGDASIVWSRVAGGANPDSSDDRALVEARTRHADGTYGEQSSVASFGPGAIEALQADRDDHGNGIALWTRADPVADQDADGTLEGDADDRSLVEVAGLDGAPPRITRFAAPSSGLPGQLLAFGVTGTDVWSPVTIHWTFGDGGPGSDQADPTRSFSEVGDYTITAQLVDNIANAAHRTSTLSIRSDQPPQPPPPPPPPVAADSVAPGLASAGVSSPCVSANLVSTQSESGPLRLRFGLSDAATVQYMIRRRVGSPGKRRCPRRSGNSPGVAEPIINGNLSLPAGPSEVQLAALPRRCRVTSRCVSPLPIGDLRGRRGPNAAKLSSLLGGRRLTPGTYTILLRATDAAGNRSPALAVKFWVLRASTRPTP